MPQDVPSEPPPGPKPKPVIRWGMTEEDYVVVYRGFDLAGLDLVESMLRAEGFEPRRLGKAQPALLGMGNATLEQLIAVAPEHEAAARALIAASQQAPSDPAQLKALEAQALDAAPIEEVRGESGVARRGVWIRIGLLLIWLALVVYAAFRQ